MSRRKRPSRGSARRSGAGMLLPTFLIVLCFVAIAGGIGGSYWAKTHRLDLDATMCPVAGPSAVYAILLDRSDPFSPVQAQRVRQVFERAVQDADVGERIDLYVLGADGTQAATPAVSLCRPKSEGNSLYENNAKLRETYLTHFRKPLEAALTPMMVSASATASPIMESVKAVCIAAFGELAKGTPARLTIASDMIQYSPVLDHYKQRDFDKFAATPSSREVLADCHRASVNVLYLVRPRDVRVQDRRHQLFWERFFEWDNAVLISVEAL